MPSEGFPAPVRAVVFDAFGTLVQLHDRRRPYRRLLDFSVAAGRKPHPDDAARIMRSDCDLRGVAAWLGVPEETELLAEIESDLAIELASIDLFPETITTLEVLREKGIRTGLCSNLAQPYARPVLDLLPFTLDAYAWSFEVGAVKPESAIYEAVSRMLALAPEEILMVGDTYEADCLGPRRQGMPALHLVRQGTSQDASFIRTLDEVLAHLALR